MSHAPFTNTCTFIAKSYECNDNCHLCHFCVALIILVVCIVMHMHTYTHTHMHNYTNRHTDICFAGVGTPTTRSTFMIVSTHTHTNKVAYESLESAIGCPTWLTFELLPYFSVNDKRMAVHRHTHTHTYIHVYGWHNFIQFAYELYFGICSLQYMSFHFTFPLSFTYKQCANALKCWKFR